MCSAAQTCALTPLFPFPAPALRGEQNQIYSGGTNSSGYQCQQNALIASWRAAFSAVPGTSAPNFPFGVTSLAGGGGEGFPLWSPTLHTTQDVWENCYVHRLRTPVCNDISDDSMGLIRRAQAGGAGFFAASSNVFLGQAHDLGEPCVCDTRAHAPNGCWANGECYGTGLYSLNVTHNYQFVNAHNTAPARCDRDCNPNDPNPTLRAPHNPKPTESAHIAAPTRCARNCDPNDPTTIPRAPPLP